MTDFYNIDKETINALEKEIQTLEKIIRHKDKMITRLRNGNVSIIEYYDKLMNLMDRTMSIAKYYKDEVKSYEDIMDADEILTNTLSDKKNIIAKNRDMIESERAEIADEFSRVNTELEFIQNMSTVIEQPTRKVKRKVGLVYDHQELAFDNDSYQKFNSVQIKSKIDRKILKYRFQTNPQLSFTEIGKKVGLSRSTVHDRFKKIIKEYEIFAESFQKPKKPTK